jgi:putative transposase
MLISLTTLLTNLSSIFHSRAALQLENLALRHQIGVLQRSVRNRPKLTLVDRLLWVWLSHIWSGWRSALAIVRPETVVAWHRKGFEVVGSNRPPKKSSLHHTSRCDRASLSSIDSLSTA